MCRSVRLRDQTKMPTVSPALMWHRRTSGQLRLTSLASAAEIRRRRSLALTPAGAPQCEPRTHRTPSSILLWILCCPSIYRRQNGREKADDLVLRRRRRHILSMNFFLGVRWIWYQAHPNGGKWVRLKSSEIFGKITLLCSIVLFAYLRYYALGSHVLKIV